MTYREDADGLTDIQGSQTLEQAGHAARHNEANAAAKSLADGLDALDAAKQAAGDYVEEGDARLTDARTPTAHAGTHGTLGTDPVSPASIGAETVGAAAAAVTDHEGAADPHPAYTTEGEAAAAAPVQSVNTQTGAVALAAGDVGADPAGTAASAVSTHEGASDPHAQYLTAQTAKNSVEIDAGDAQLVGDQATPPASRYYGTDGAGARGFHELPSGGGGDVPSPHALGGTHHSADTLANLNTKISDATLDDSSAARTPSSHAASHATGGSDPMSPGDIGAATAAQGGLADTAVQPGDDAATLGSGAAPDGHVPTADGAGGLAFEAPASGTNEAVAATPNTLALRDANGRTKVADGTAADDVGTKGQIDAAQALAIQRDNHTGTQGAATLTVPAAAAAGDLFLLRVATGGTTLEFVEITEDEA